MTGLKILTNDEEVESSLKNMGADRCSVLYFFLPWCGACQKMNPFVESIAQKNPNTFFIKVDAEKCISSSKRHKITKVPLFIIYSNRTRVDRVEGASPIELETKIKRIQAELSRKHSGSPPKAIENAGLSGLTTKMTDISQYFDKKNCRVVNDLIPTTFQGFIEGNKLISGKGVGRVLLSYVFTEKMVIQSFKIKAPIHSGPKVLRFFTSLPRNVDIFDLGQMTALQEIVLSEEDLGGEHKIDLRQGGFVGISALQVYIPESMANGRRIEMDFLILNGAPLSPKSHDPETITIAKPKTFNGPGIRY